MRIMLMAALVLAGCGDNHHDHKHDTKPDATKVKDPVCGMQIDKGAKTAEFDNATWHFCSDDCAAKFKADPAKYVKACACAKTMKKCDCSHCAGHKVPCDCP